MSTGVGRKANTRGGGALERGHGAPLEPLAQFGDAVGGVGALAFPIEAADLIAGQAAKVGSVAVSMGADTKANISGVAAHLSSVIFVSFRMAASAVAPSAPMSLPKRLRARGGMGNGERV